MDAGVPLTTLKGVGPALAAKFAVLGIHSVYDLIRAVPRRYDDYSELMPIGNLQPGEVTVQATISTSAGRYVRRGMHITEATATDASGSVRLVWFNQPYRAAAIKAGQSYYISGKFGLSNQRFVITNPAIELVSDLPKNTARIIPIYRETKGLTSRHYRAAHVQAISYMQQLPETLPDWLIQQNRLISRAAAYQQLHLPGSRAELEAARQRLGFEEVFELMLANLLIKLELQHERAPEVPFVEAVVRRFVSAMPFDLTDAQRRVAWQIFQDMQRTQPMNRLVEGDVGAGKTVVAALAAIMVLHHGHQAALMAPTELLARQHADTLQKLLQPVGLDNRVGLLVGGMAKRAKDMARQRVASGEIGLLIGTHALIQDSVTMEGLELVIIDEQHRFGVGQRKRLIAKAGHMPHALSLTATPIPRSLALTLYGELDISILDQKPAGRQPIETTIESPNSRAQLNKAITTQLEAGRQMFVVCPLISESDKLDISSAEATYERMRGKDFKAWRVGLLHGKMKPDEKNAIMAEFVAHKLDILVSTTVIEVGVDVPNASIMLIEAAERFGLAQVHQLRGRIGRGGHAGYCYLMMSDSKAPSQRLRALEQLNDGFRLAELDLELRGPGALYGTMQHGALDLSIASLTDSVLLANAQAAARSFVDRGEDLLQYRQLQERVIAIQAVTNLN